MGQWRFDEPPTEAAGRPLPRGVGGGDAGDLWVGVGGVGGDGKVGLGRAAPGGEAGSGVRVVQAAHRARGSRRASPAAPLDLRTIVRAAALLLGTGNVSLDAQKNILSTRRRVSSVSAPHFPACQEADATQRARAVGEPLGRGAPLLQLLQASRGAHARHG